jgi:hypothetical protein
LGYGLEIGEEGKGSHRQLGDDTDVAHESKSKTLRSQIYIITVIINIIAVIIFAVNITLSLITVFILH